MFTQSEDDLLVQLEQENDDELISLIYQAASEPELWPDLLKKLYLTIDHYQTSSTHSPYSLFHAMEGDLEETTPLTADNPMLRRIFGHLSQAIKITKKIYEIEEYHQIQRSLLNRIPVGLVLLTEEGVIHDANNMAQKMIEESPYIKEVNGKLFLTNNEIHQQMKDIVRTLSVQSSSTKVSRGLSLADKKAKSRPMAVFTPLNIASSSMFEFRSQVAVFLSNDDSHHDLELSALADIYQLTPKELRIVEQLVQGLPVPEIAKKLYVSYNTVRTQLKSIFHKMDVNSQSELLNNILTGPASMLFQNHSILDPNCHMESLDRRITLADGRRISYRERGYPNGYPVLICHSIIGSRLECFDLHQDWAQRQGLRLIIPDRPGYGFSDPIPSVNYSKWADDTIEFMEQLGIKEFAVVGYAIGGNYACELAIQYPDRVKRLHLISSGQPLDNPNELEKTTPLFMMQAQMAIHYPRLYRLLLVILERCLSKSSRYYLDLLMTELSPTDYLMMENKDIEQMIERSGAEASRQGIRIFLDELSHYSCCHDIHYDQVKCPVTQWHGQESSYISLQTAKKMNQQFPNAILHVIPNGGHLIAYQKWPDIVAELHDELNL